MRERLKTQILNVVEDWISNCNDDICYNIENILAPNAEAHLRELYSRKATLVKFKAAFDRGLQVGPNAYDREVFVEVVEFLIDMEEQMVTMDAATSNP